MKSVLSGTLLYLNKCMFLSHIYHLTANLLQILFFLTLLLLFHSSNRQKFGNIIFKPIIDELNFLRVTGIDIDTDDFNGNIKFELGL